jgi:Zn-finger nucleic acid-binding protein
MDGSDLVMADRQGIEIDYCPKCRGVWLDRGELDKIIERAAVQAQPVMAAAGAQPFPASPPRAEAGYDQSYERRDDKRYGKRDDPRYDQPYEQRPDQRQDQRRRKRGGFLSELFEFGD